MHLRGFFFCQIVKENGFDRNTFCVRCIIEKRNRILHIKWITSHERIFSRFQRLNYFVLNTCLYFSGQSRLNWHKLFSVQLLKFFSGNVVWRVSSLIISRNHCRYTSIIITLKVKILI